MEALPWLEWLGSLPHAEFLRGSATAYLLVNAAHILGIGLLVGAILPLDLRLMGVARRGALAEIAPFLARFAAIGLALAIVTGFLLFSVKPADYAGNPAFLIKIGLVLLGLVNIVVQHSNRRWVLLKQGLAPSIAVRILAGLSCAIWLFALIAGRWIGFL